MIINFDMDIELSADLQISILKICIKTDDLKSLKYYLDKYDIDPSIETGYLIRHSRRHKAEKIIMYLASLEEVQKCFNMDETDLLVKYLYNWKDTK